MVVDAESMIRELEMYYPWIAEDAVRYVPRGESSLVVFTKDGEASIYNYYENTIRTVMEYDGSEEAWKREFANALVEKMADRGYDQSALSKRSGVSQVSIGKYIHRQAIPSGYTIDRIARALKCRAEDLTSFEVQS